MISKEELERYSRQLRLPDWDNQSQIKLKNSSVLVVGAGALGCAVLPYLVAAGVGRIGIVDGDRIELSNLHRQVLYSELEIGQSKAIVAAKKMVALNSSIQIEAFESFLNNENAFFVTSSFDIIIDGTDNFPTRYLVNDLCFFSKKVNIHGSIQGYEGQVAIFNALLDSGIRSANYRDLFPHPPMATEVKSCEENGVIGALPGIIGSMMALQTIQYILGKKDVLINRLFQIDTQTFQTQVLKYKADPNNPLTRDQDRQITLVNYSDFCGIPNRNPMKEITVEALREWQSKGELAQLIDVREPHEFDDLEMGGTLIPMGQVPARMNEISKEGKVVIQCRSGARSANVIQYLEQHGYNNLYNLKGGILAWLASH